MRQFSAIAAATLLFAAGVSPHAAMAQSAPLIEIPSGAPADLFTGQRSREVLAVQVLLDRAKHSPGVIDGMMGGNTRRAIRAYQSANGLSVTGEVDSALVERLVQAHGGDLFQTYTISSDDADGPFRNIPSGMSAMADLDSLSYESPAELLAEKFHMAQSFLTALNPGTNFSSAGTSILVIKPGSEKLSASVSRIEVDKAANELRAYAEGGQLVATYPTTVGSNVHPSPNDKLEVVAVAPAPTYHFDPEGRSWGPDEKLTIAAGPNNPVGAVWIDLSRDGFGIHGTPDPKLIGKTSSHGCVRLTNWDAEEVADAVSKGTTVVSV